MSRKTIFTIIMILSLGGLGLVLFFFQPEISAPTNEIINEDLSQSKIPILKSEFVELEIPEGWSRNDINDVPGTASADFKQRLENEDDYYECGMVKNGGHIMLTIVPVSTSELSDITPRMYAESLLPGEISDANNFAAELIEVDDYSFAKLSRYSHSCINGDISINARIDKKLISVHYQYSGERTEAEKFFATVVDKIKIK